MVLRAAYTSVSCSKLRKSSPPPCFFSRLATILSQSLTDKTPTKRSVGRFAHSTCLPTKTIPFHTILSVRLAWKLFSVLCSYFDLKNVAGITEGRKAWCLCLRFNSAVCFCWNKLRWRPTVEGRLHIEPWESGMVRDNFLALYVPDIKLKYIK
jgi:hypothetical protein